MKLQAGGAALTATEESARWVENIVGRERRLVIDGVGTEVGFSHVD